MGMIRWGYVEYGYEYEYLVSGRGGDGVRIE